MADEAKARQDGTARDAQAAEIDRKLRALVRTLAQMAAKADYRAHQKATNPSPKDSDQ